jgi:hypothetical protein
MKAYCIRDKKSGLYWSGNTQGFSSKTCVPKLYTLRRSAEQMAFKNGTIAMLVRHENDPSSHMYKRGYWDWDPEIVEVEITFK